MAIRFYDEAMVKEIEEWVGDPNIQILKPGELTRLIQLKADKSGDELIRLPVISLSREPEIEILSTNKKPLTFDGKMIRAENERSLQLDAIPIRVSYQLDIYTKRFDEGDEYVREFIFKIINNPKLKIIIPYNNAALTYNVNMRIESNVEDTSDIPQRLFSGQFTRWTLKLYIDDAYLFSVPSLPTISIDGDNNEIEFKY